MAKVQMNPVVERVRGKIGDLVFKKYQDGVVVGRRADRDGLVPSPSQTTHREQFRRASAYGKQACANPALKNAAGAAKEDLRMKIQDRPNGLEKNHMPSPMNTDKKQTPSSGSHPRSSASIRGSSSYAFSDAMRTADKRRCTRITGRMTHLRRQ
jgi:hypothetical protein